MPSIHIPEGNFSQLVSQTGGYTEAKQRVKKLVEKEVRNHEQ